jgi:hypothetical protein
MVVVAVVTGCANPGGHTVDGPTCTGKCDGSGPTNGTYLIHETFNTMTTGAPPSGAWTTTGAVAVREVPFAANKSAEVSKPAGTSTSTLAFSFPGQRGRVVFEAKVMAREAMGFKAIPYVYDSTGAPVASVAFLDGNLVAHVGASTVTVQAITANLWYRVRLVVDTAQGTFDL